MTESEPRLAAKIALVTGGTKGIGRATVLAFLRAGASVVFTGSSANPGPALEAELRAQGHEARFVQCDSRDEQQVIDLIGRIVALYGRLDIAVNNVGSVAPTDDNMVMVHEASLQGFQDTIDMALRSTFLSMKHELAVMLGQGGGVICNTSSIAGVRVSTVGSPAYHAAKAAVIHLTRKTAIQYAKSNIRVNVVAPGATSTEQVLNRFTREEFDALAGGVHPMGKAVSPEEVAAAFLFLCSDAAASITGHLLPIDGGWTAT